MSSGKLKAAQSDVDLSSPQTHPISPGPTQQEKQDKRARDMQRSEDRAKIQLQRLGSDPVLPLLLKFSVPSIIGMICTTIYSNADVSFIGQYEGNIGLAAAGIFTPFQGLVYLAFCLALAIGASATISPALGRKDYNGANDAFFHFMIIGMIYAVVAPVIFVPWMRTLARLLGAGAGVIEEYTVNYAYVMSGVGPIAYFLGISLIPITRNENRPVVAMILQICAAVLNVFLDAILFPLAGWYLHIQAAAIATVVANLVVGLVIILNFSGVLRQGLLRFTIRKIREIKPKMFWQILMIGLPQFIVMMPSNLCPILGNSIIRKLDISPWMPHLTPLQDTILRDSYQGAYGIAVRVSLICGMPANGIYQGFLSILGYNLGAKNYKRVYQLIYVTMACIFIIMAVLWGIMQGIANYFVLIYINKGEQNLQDLAAKLLRLTIAGYPVLGFIFIASAIAQMEHRPWIALVLQLSRAALTISFLYLFPYVIFKGSIISLFYSFMVGDISMSLISLIVLWYYLVKYKRLAKKQEAEKGDAAHGDAEMTEHTVMTSVTATVTDPNVGNMSPFEDAPPSSANLGCMSVADPKESAEIDPNVDMFAVSKETRE